MQSQHTVLCKCSDKPCSCGIGTAISTGSSCKVAKKGQSHFVHGSLPPQRNPVEFCPLKDLILESMVASQLDTPAGTQPAANGAAAAAAGEREGAPPPHNIHVLLVDDERLSRVVVANLLRKCNYRVTVAEGGTQALQLLEREAPGTFQLVLTDVMMPQVDGLDVLRFVRSHELLSSLPVIMMSASEQAEMMYNCIKGGAEEYLVKPVTKKEVQNIWTHVIRRLHASNGASKALQGLQFLPAPAGSGAALPQLPAANPRNGHIGAPAALPGSAENPIVLYPPGYTNGHTGHEAAGAAGGSAGRQMALPAGQGNGALQLNGNGAITIAAPNCVGGFEAQQEAGAMQQASKRRAVGSQHPRPQPVHHGQQNGVGPSDHHHAATANGPGGAAPPAGLAHQSLLAKVAGQMSKQQLQQAAGSPNDQVSLLAWLVRPSRVVQPRDSFWIFTEVMLLLETYHAHSASSVRRVRPSRLTLHRNGRVTFAADAPPSAVQSPGSNSKANGVTANAGAAQGDPRSSRMAGSHATDGRAQQQPGPGPPGHAGGVLAGMIDEEEQLYASPEEVQGRPGTSASDVFSLGILFFDLFFAAPSNQGPAARHRILADVRNRILPPAFLMNHPKEAAFALALTHPDPAARPTVAELLGSSMFKEVVKAVRQRHGALRAAEAQLEAEVLAEFLGLMRGRKSHEIQAAREELSALCSDIQALEKHLEARLGARHKLKRQHSAPTRTSSRLRLQVPPTSGLGPHGQQTPGRTGSGLCPPSPAHSMGGPTASQSTYQNGPTSSRATALADTAACTSPFTNGTTTPGSTRGGAPPEDGFMGPATLYNVTSPSAAGVAPGGGQTAASSRDENASLKAAQQHWERMAPHLPQLLEAYKQRQAEAQAAGTSKGGPPANRKALPAPSPAAAAEGAGGSGGADATPPAAPPALPGHVTSFCEDLSRFTRYQKLEVQATLQHGGGDSAASNNMVCSVAFNRDDEYFATAGVSKRIRIYELAGVVSGAPVGGAYPVLEISSRSRLSSVCWSSYIQGHLACSDYEGVVALWDANANMELMQYEEHAKRVWAVDFSRLDPTRLASCSDDGTVRVWAINQEACAARINCRVNVCSVQWSPEYPHLLAAGASNCKAYLYDLRRHDTPLGVIPGHSKSVSYVRHASGSQLLTASTDSTVRLWDVTGSSAGVSLADVMHDVEGSGGVDGDAKGAGPSAAADAAGGQANGAAGQWGSHSTPRLAVTPRLTYRGHINERNFVGLSVSSEGYIACGSEDNSVYVYCQGFSMPALRHSFSAASQHQGLLGRLAGDAAIDNGVATSRDTSATGFVSSVSWAQRGNILLAANSIGHVQVLALT